ncbi:MAG: thioredoxin [Dehalococcoidia bacterium]|nr:thioredoxin [Dehalococcoidia bacterium]
MSKVIEVTDKNFEEEVLKSDIPVEVDFWAPWCGPCRMVTPIYEKLAGEYDGKFKFCKLNVDESQQMAVKYQVMSIPLQIYFGNGQKVDEILGAVPEKVIRAKVEEITKKFPSDEKGKLKMILTSWIENNKESSEKLGKWMERNQNTEGIANYAGLKEAALQIEKANEKLSQALT